MNKTLLIILGLALVFALIIGGQYNGFVRGSEAVDAQWAQVEGQYQRRFDLVPNLVASVEGIMKQEKEVFGALADARTKYAGAVTTDAKVAAAGEFDSALSRLLVVMENYPQLRSVETVQSLMAEIAGTENRISVERGRFNDMVRDFNVSVKTFPGTLVARLFGFEARALFEAATGADVAPKVEF
jgi:LemA protein